MNLQRTLLTLALSTAASPQRPNSSGSAPLSHQIQASFPLADIFASLTATSEEAASDYELSLASLVGTETAGTVVFSGGEGYDFEHMPIPSLLTLYALVLQVTASPEGWSGPVLATYTQFGEDIVLPLLPGSFHVIYFGPDGASAAGAGTMTIADMPDGLAIKTTVIAKLDPSA